MESEKKDGLIKKGNARGSHPDPSQKRIIEYQTIVVSAVTVFVYALLYAFNESVFSKYHISRDCIRITLTDFLPALVFIVAIFSFGYDYFDQIRIDAKSGKKHMNPTRIYRFVVVECLLVLGIGLFRLVDNVWKLVALMVVIPIAFELIINLSISSDSVKSDNKALNEDNRGAGRNVEQKWSSRVLVKAFGAMIVIICLMPLCGGIYVKIKNEYQIFTHQGKQYAVIKDFGEDFIAERCTIKYGCITIDTSKYMFFEKNNLTFSSQGFDAVILDSITSE